MPKYTIKEVVSKKDLKEFIKFPDDLYKHCKQYVPALHSDQIYSLTEDPALAYCLHKLWMVFDGKKVVGRICGMINPRYNARYDKKRARFGWFDSINDIKVAGMLLGEAENWARENGMNEVHGPLYYNTFGKQGMLVEGFENVPPFNCLYNFPYYNDLVSSLGYVKECDWLQYKMDARQEPQDKMKRIAAILKEKYHLHEGNIDEMKKDKKMVDYFFKVYNESFAAAVYNFIPFTEEEIKNEAKLALHFLSDKVGSIVLDENNELVAFGIGFPTISPALQKAKGHMFPFGWLHLFRAIHNFEVVDLMINGAVPKWQNTGVSAVYHCAMSKKYRKAGTKWAISNPQIETNSAVNVWGKYEHELYMRRRCYVKSV
ncbi:MAG: hypothetical protein LKI42_01790 [Bacteroidales bacterium]|jgi:hypothetical protein|nr:hypothetical protein [Bacteroidales bacterium]MCI1785425.1 hypothetical protein [Bacteroidales bacterium]